MLSITKARTPSAQDVLASDLRAAWQFGNAVQARDITRGACTAGPDVAMEALIELTAADGGFNDGQLQAMTEDTRVCAFGTLTFVLEVFRLAAMTKYERHSLTACRYVSHLYRHGPRIDRDALAGLLLPASMLAGLGEVVASGKVLQPIDEGHRADHCNVCALYQVIALHHGPIATGKTHLTLMQS